MTRKAFCRRFVGLLSIGLLSIGPSKAFSSSRQNGQELTGSRKNIFHSPLKVKDRQHLKGLVSYEERDEKRESELKHP